MDVAGRFSSARARFVASSAVGLQQHERRLTREWAPTSILAPTSASYQSRHRTDLLRLFISLRTDSVCRVTFVAVAIDGDVVSTTRGNKGAVAAGTHRAA